MAEEEEGEGEGAETIKPKRTNAWMLAARAVSFLLGILSVTLPHSLDFLRTQSGSDLMAAIQAIGATDHERQQGRNVSAFCDTHSLRYKGVQEVFQLRQQLLRQSKSTG